MSTQTKMIKSKGMKDYKKAQKQKVIAKRAAAAEKSKQDKAVKVELVEDEQIVSRNTVQQDVSFVDESIIVKTSVGSRDEISTVQGSASMDNTVINHGAPVAESSIESPVADHSDSMHDELTTDDTIASYQSIRRDMVPKDFRLIIAFTPALDQQSYDHDPNLGNSTTPSVDTISIKAHRKALEAALYENMESPRERMSRLALTKSADAEFNENQYQYDFMTPENTFEVTSPNLMRATDSNDFDILAVYTAPPIETPIYRSLSIQDLFSKVLDSGFSIVGSSNAQHSQTLVDVESLQEISQGHVNGSITRSSSSDDLLATNSLSSVSDNEQSDTPLSHISTYVESWQATLHDNVHLTREEEDRKSFSVDQLFAAAVAEGKPVVKLPAESTEEDTCHAQEPMLMSIAFGCDGQPEEFQSSIDPAIVSYKIKNQHDTHGSCHPMKDIIHHDPETNTTLQDGAKNIMSLIGANRPRTVSVESTAYSLPSSAPFDTRVPTPLTQYSESPLPLPCQHQSDPTSAQSFPPTKYDNYHDSYSIAGGVDLFWSQNTMDTMNTPHPPVVLVDPLQPPFHHGFVGHSFLHSAHHGQNLVQETTISKSSLFCEDFVPGRLFHSSDAYWQTEDYMGYAQY